MKKMLACLLVMAFALCFAACNNDGNEAPPTDGVTTGTDIPASENTIPPETDPTQPMPSESETADSQNTGTSEAVTGTSVAPALADVPQDKAGILAFYNAALAKTDMQRTAYKRVLTKVTATAALNVLNEQNLQDNGDVQVLGNMDEKKNAPSDLVALTAAQVKSASSRVDGTAAILTIVMQDYALGTVANPVSGTNGYVGTVDKPTVERLVEDAAMVLAGSVLREVRDTSSQYGLSDGKYTITVDTVTGKLKSVRFTGNEFGTGKATAVVKIVPIPVGADVMIRASMDSTYGAK